MELTDRGDRTRRPAPLVGLVEGLADRRTETRALMRDAARALRLHLGLQVGFVSRIDAVSRTLLAVDVEAGAGAVAMAANIYEGRVDPVEDNFCHRVLTGQVPNALDDAATHPVAGPILAAAGAKIGGFINVAVRLQDGSLYGTICCFDAEPARGLGPRDVDLMNAVAELLGRRLERDLQNGRERRLFRNAVARTIEDCRIGFVLQPIVELRSRLRFAEEVLSRFDLIPNESPQATIRRAYELGLGEPLEKAILDLLVRQTGPASGDEAPALFVNLTPALLLEPTVAHALTSIPRPVVAEMTEEMAYAADDMILRVVAQLRASGVRIAVDDFGCGFSNFETLIKISPDFIKLSGSLVLGVGDDALRAATISAVVALAEAVGAQLIAEGVETEADALRLAELGVRFGQGWAFDQLPAGGAVSLGGSPPEQPQR